MEAGADFFTSVPCRYLDPVIRALHATPGVTHIAVTREEEGVGLCAGAALAGHAPVLLMQNSGIGNALNALCSLTSLYDLPLFMLVSHRGLIGEQAVAQAPMGQATEAVLRAANIACFTESGSLHPTTVADHYRYSRLIRKPVALLVPPRAWEPS